MNYMQYGIFIAYCNRLQSKYIGIEPCCDPTLISRNDPAKLLLKTLRSNPFSKTRSQKWRLSVVTEKGPDPSTPQHKAQLQ